MLAATAVFLTAHGRVSVLVCLSFTLQSPIHFSLKAVPVLLRRNMANYLSTGEAGYSASTSFYRYFPHTALCLAYATCVARETGNGE